MNFPLEFILTTFLSKAFMGNGKKKHGKKNELSEDVLGIAAISIKKFRKVTKQIGKLSTGQKLVGGVALLAAGLTYLAKTEGETTVPVADPLAPERGPASAAKTHSHAEATAATPAKPVKSPRKIRKGPKDE